jgi:hypothetical protein
VLKLHERLDDPGTMDEPVDNAEPSTHLAGQRFDGPPIGDVQHMG